MFPSLPLPFLVIPFMFDVDGGTPFPPPPPPIDAINFMVLFVIFPLSLPLIPVGVDFVGDRVVGDVAVGSGVCFITDGNVVKGIGDGAFVEGTVLVGCLVGGDVVVNAGATDTGATDAGATDAGATDAGTKDGSLPSGTVERGAVVSDGRNVGGLELEGGDTGDDVSRFAIFTTKLE